MLAMWVRHEEVRLETGRVDDDAKYPLHSFV